MENNLITVCEKKSIGIAYFWDGDFETFMNSCFRTSLKHIWFSKLFDDDNGQRLVWNYLKNGLPESLEENRLVFNIVPFETWICVTEGKGWTKLDILTQEEFEKTMERVLIG